MRRLFMLPLWRLGRRIPPEIFRHHHRRCKGLPGHRFRTGMARLAFASRFQAIFLLVTICTPRKRLARRQPGLSVGGPVRGICLVSSRPQETRGRLSYCDWRTQHSPSTRICFRHHECARLHATPRSRSVLELHQRVCPAPGPPTSVTRSFLPPHRLPPSLRLGLIPTRRLRPGGHAMPLLRPYHSPHLWASHTLAPWTPFT